MTAIVRRQYTDEEKAELVQRINRIRIDEKKTLGEACKDVGVSMSNYSRWKPGGCSADPSTPETESADEESFSIVDALIAKEVQGVPDEIIDWYNDTLALRDKFNDAGAVDLATLLDDEVLVKFARAAGWEECL